MSTPSKQLHTKELCLRDCIGCWREFQFSSKVTYAIWKIEQACQLDVREVSNSISGTQISTSRHQIHARSSRWRVRFKTNKQVVRNQAGGRKSSRALFGWLGQLNRRPVCSSQICSNISCSGLLATISCIIHAKPLEATLECAFGCLYLGC